MKLLIVLLLITLNIEALTIKTHIKDLINNTNTQSTGNQNEDSSKDDKIESDLVGTTKGSFSINQGVANYKLQITVPPGVAGMEPKISLNYSSSSKNGYLGYGWNIEGVSTITRCPQNKLDDGTNFIPGVNYSSSDRFCLDGQRLVAINGKYGEDGTEYRTQINNYSKIIQHGKFDGKKGPNWFEVKTKSGLTYKYGYSIESEKPENVFDIAKDKERALNFIKEVYNSLENDLTSNDNYRDVPYLIVNRQKAFWKVNEISDSYGNKIKFHYKSDLKTGKHYIDKITYADNEVDFKYENRDDNKITFTKGDIVSMSKRLKSIIVKTGSKEVRRYNLKYTTTNYGSKTSILTSITEHVPAGDLKSLKLTYQYKKGAFEKSTTL